MRWSHLLFLCLTAFSLCAEETPIGLLERLPKSLGGCEAGRIQPFKDTGLGATVNYSVSGLLIAVYAYDLGQEDIPDGIAGGAVQEAYQLAMDDLKDGASQGYYAQVEERDKGTAKYAVGQTLRARYHLTRLKGDDAGKRCTSEIHLFGANGLMIKVRVTGKIEHEAADRKVVEQFMPELLEAVKKPASALPVVPKA